MSVSHVTERKHQEGRFYLHRQCVDPLRQMKICSNLGNLRGNPRVHDAGVIDVSVGGSPGPTPARTQLVICADQYMPWKTTGMKINPYVYTYRKTAQALIVSMGKCRSRMHRAMFYQRNVSLGK